MTIRTTIDVGIPFPVQTDSPARLAYLERAKAAVQTIQEMVGYGAKVEAPTEKDREISRQIAARGTQKSIISESDAPMLVHLDALLARYDFELLDSARRLNNFVVNRLLEESENDDPRVRLRALELLGKTSHAKVFSDNIDINVTHTSVKEIDKELDRLAMRYMGAAQVVEDATVRPVRDDDPSTD